MTSHGDNGAYLSTIDRKVHEGKAVLFLGAGINWDCKNSKSEKAPIGNELANSIKNSFFPGEVLPNDLQTVSACVDSRASRPELERFIYDLLIDFKPCEKVLKQIPNYL